MTCGRSGVMYCLRRSALPILLGVAAWYPADAVLAQGTPWIAEPRTGSVSVSYYNQNAEEFFRGTESVKGPLEATGANLAQNTVWIHANYALNDAMAVDLQTAWAKSFVEGAVGPSGGEESYSGLYDTNIAVTWRFVDELVSNAPSAAVRLGVILAGGYDTGYINSLGDGGSGFEGSLIVGKFWDVGGVSAEVGYRNRGSTRPSILTRSAPPGVTRSTYHRTCSPTSGDLCPLARGCESARITVLSMRHPGWT